MGEEGGSEREMKRRERGRETEADRERERERGREREREREKATGRNLPAKLYRGRSTITCELYRDGSSYYTPCSKRLAGRINH